MKAIIITGSVATGKTTLAKKLAKEKNLIYIDVTKLIKENKLSEGFDKKRDCEIIDIEKLNKVLIDKIKSSKKQLIIDSHLSHYLPKKYVEKCIVCKCNLKELKKRLKKRKYSKEKIEENLQAEIFDVCLNEAKEKGHKIIIIETNKS
jgi:adenylate kinase